MSPPNGAFARHVRDAAARFVARRFVPVPVRFGTKKPNLLDGWERLRLDPAGPADVRFDLDTHFPVSERRNIGIVLGEASDGLVDADFDCREARVAAGVLMPATGMAWGRTSAPDSHLGYVVDRPPVKATDEYADPADPKRGKHGGLLLELRWTGGQTVVPPSRYAADAEGGRPEEPAVRSRTACGRSRTRQTRCRRESPPRGGRNSPPDSVGTGRRSSLGFESGWGFAPTNARIRRADRVVGKHQCRKCRMSDGVGCGRFRRGNRSRSICSRP